MFFFSVGHTKVTQVTRQIYKGYYMINEEACLCLVVSSSHMHLVDFSTIHNLVVKATLGMTLMYIHTYIHTYINVFIFTRVNTFSSLGKCNNCHEFRYESRSEGALNFLTQLFRSHINVNSSEPLCRVKKASLSPLIALPKNTLMKLRGTLKCTLSSRHRPLLR